MTNDYYCFAGLTIVVYAVSLIGSYWIGRTRDRECREKYGESIGVSFLFRCWRIVAFVGSFVFVASILFLGRWGTFGRSFAESVLLAGIFCLTLTAVFSFYIPIVVFSNRFERAADREIANRPNKKRYDSIDYLELAKRLRRVNQILIGFLVILPIVLVGAKATATFLAWTEFLPESFSILNNLGYWTAIQGTAVILILAIVAEYRLKRYIPDEIRRLEQYRRLGASDRRGENSQRSRLFDPFVVFRTRFKTCRTFGKSIAGRRLIERTPILAPFQAFSYRSRSETTESPKTSFLSKLSR